MVWGLVKQVKWSERRISELQFDYNGDNYNNRLELKLAKLEEKTLGGWGTV